MDRECTIKASFEVGRAFLNGTTKNTAHQKGLKMKPKAYHKANCKVAILFIVVLMLTFTPLSSESVSAAALTTWSINVSPSSGYAGSTVTVSGSGFTPGFPPTGIRWDGGSLFPFTMPASGSFSRIFTIPAGALHGIHTISVKNTVIFISQIKNVSFEVLEEPTPTHTFTPTPPTNTPTPTPTATPTQTATPTGTNMSAETQPQAGGEKPLPGEVFVDQPVLFVPDCTPSEAKFSALIFDPVFSPLDITLLVLPAGEASMLWLPMEEDASGVYRASLQLNEGDPAGEWHYSVVAVVESGVSYRSEPGTLSVNDCGGGISGPLASDPRLQLIPYMAIMMLTCSGIGLLVLAVILVVRWSRRR